MFGFHTSWENYHTIYDIRMKKMRAVSFRARMVSIFIIRQIGSVQLYHAFDVRSNLLSEANNQDLPWAKTVQSS